MLEAVGGGGGIGSEMSQAVADVGKAATAGAVDARNAAVGEQAKQMAGAAQQLQASAASGGFKLEPDAAATLIAACNHSLQVLSGTMAKLQVVSQAPALGKTPGALVVGPFTQKVASNGDSGMLETVQNLQQTITQMRQAYQQASSNYQETEQQVAQDLKKYQSDT